MEKQHNSKNVQSIIFVFICFKLPEQPEKAVSVNKDQLKTKLEIQLFEGRQSSLAIKPHEVRLTQYANFKTQYVFI